MKEKFLEKLKEIFQFESSDLDFGIYRIFNYKRERIEDFIKKELPNKIESAFEKHKEKILENINPELVYNDLYTFFSRFYEYGDFVPQYRYSIKGHKYAIPYNGEEVKLYWANAE
jgi:adenine-specific DNA-methyltransferase